ncbi:MAG: hypothetical protein P8P78_04105 [Flavobacteriaceae bacterium]|nr:hypothetical protein [Flavobacteriaceae bacterium]
MLIFLTSPSFGQKSIPSQKQYVIVKSTFDFLKQVNRYKANSFTKFLFSKAGYEVYLDNEELPEELYYNKCSALHVDVKDKSNLFATRNFIELADCNGKVLYTSKLGTSKLKDYERSYRQSIRNAFFTIENLNLIYASFSSQKIENSTTENKTQELKKASEVIVNEIPTIEVSDSTTKEKKTSTTYVLTAQKSKTGYQLINSTNELVFEILNTSKKDVFIIKNKNGVLSNKGNHWLVEYYDEQLLITRKLQIKF